MPPSILTNEEMKRGYGTFFGSGKKQELDKNTVPEELWPLLPYAEFWGEPDEVARESLVDKAPTDVQRNLKDVVAAFEDALEGWLTGPEADSREPTDAYIAFAALMTSSRKRPGLTLGFFFLAWPIRLPAACCLPPWNCWTQNQWLG